MVCSNDWAIWQLSGTGGTGGLERLGGARTKQLTRALKHWFQWIPHSIFWRERWTVDFSGFCASCSDMSVESNTQNPGIGAILCISDFSGIYKSIFRRAVALKQGFHWNLHITFQQGGRLHIPAGTLNTFRILLMALYFNRSVWVSILVNSTHRIQAAVLNYLFQWNIQLHMRAVNY